MFMSTWTWAKELSDIDDTGYSDLNTQIENTYDRRRDRGNVYAVPRHQWMNNFLYNLPLGRGPLLERMAVERAAQSSERQLADADLLRVRSLRARIRSPGGPTW